MTSQIDVNVCFYGKPYHTILAVKSLLKFSRQHINKIYITVEKKQPQQDDLGIFLVKQALKNEPIVYFYPDYFYNLGELDTQKVKESSAYRYQIPYQYVLEKSDRPFVFVMHNDCLFHGDMLGKMLDTIQKSNKEIAGIGPIGQCWNCPASFENLCDSSKFMEFKRSKEELTELMNRHTIPRPEITMRLINEGKTHPLPECRLNEYASLINTKIYRENCLPHGPLVSYAGNWGGNDWGTVWFYQMVNQGFHFIHQRLEEFAKHAPFNEMENGISAYSNKNLYLESEMQAKKYLEEVYSIPLTLSFKNQILQNLFSLKIKFKRKIGQLLFG
ncbi:MAG: hypothetical protein ACK4UP_11980 [Spirosomataceae bacterium]